LRKKGVKIDKKIVS